MITKEADKWSAIVILEKKKHITEQKSKKYLEMKLTIIDTNIENNIILKIIKFS